MADTNRLLSRSEARFAADEGVGGDVAEQHPGPAPYVPGDHLMRTRLMIATLAGVAMGLTLSHFSLPGPAQSQDAQSAKKLAAPTELEGLKASAAAFEKAFNAGDAKAIAAQFTENAEAVDDEGNILESRAAIEARFAELFKDAPKARIVVELTSLRQLSPEVAVEDGYSTTTLNPEEPGSRSPYTAVHVKRDGKWLMASVRDFPEEFTEAMAHEQLQALEWLIGHWVDESPDGRVETTCQWSEDGNYLLQDYSVKSRWGGTMKGSQRIAWDPLRHTVRSWAFDQSGAFTEATWTPLEDAWIVKAEGVTPDGQGVSATRYLTLFDNDSFQIDSPSLVMGHDVLPDASVRVVRRPPAPAE
jgi:uncharacterized protein (TIGR02246 family)